MRNQISLRRWSLWLALALSLPAVSNHFERPSDVGIVSYKRYINALVE